MTVVDLDSLFLLNLSLNYLLLRVTARVAGCPFSRRRLAAAAALGALYAAANFLPGMAFLSHWLVKLCAGVLMVLAAFGSQPRLLRLAVLFFALSCALGGGILAISLLGGTGLSLANGIPATGMDLKVVLLSAAGCYVLLSLVLRRWGRHSRAEGALVSLALELESRQVVLTALTDTGNTLSDPLDNQPAAVVEWRCVQPLLPPGVTLTQQDADHPAQGMERLCAQWPRSRLRLLPYRAVGVSCGMLLALRVDRGVVDGREQKGLLVALSPGPVSDGGGYQALVNGG